MASSLPLKGKYNLGYFYTLAMSIMLNPYESIENKPSYTIFHFYELQYLIRVKVTLINKLANS